MRVEAPVCLASVVPLALLRQSRSQQGPCFRQRWTNCPALHPLAQRPGRNHQESGSGARRSLCRPSTPTEQMSCRSFHTCIPVNEVVNMASPGRAKKLTSSTERSLETFRSSRYDSPVPSAMFFETRAVSDHAGGEGEVEEQARHEAQDAGNRRGPEANFVLIAQLDRLSSSQRR